MAAKEKQTQFPQKPKTDDPMTPKKDLANDNDDITTDDDDDADADAI